MTSPDAGQQSNSKRKWFQKLATFWTLIVLVTAFAVGIFADLGEDVAAKSTTAFDEAVRTWIMAHQNPIVYKIAYFITWAGSPVVMIIVAALAGAWFYQRRGRSKAGVMIAAPAVGGVVSFVVKYLFGRARPAGGALLNERSYSFPSGHALTSAAVMVTLCYVLAREGIISWRSAILIGGTVPLLVGLSRLYLDVHWTTDVVGGWAAGLFVAAMSAALYEFLMRTAPPAVDRATT